MNSFQRRSRTAAWPRQRGGIAIIFGVLLIVMIGMAALALDLARIYNRKAELQNVAQAAAMAAAAELNGTAAGIGSAVSRAQTVAAGMRYNYGNADISLPAAAISFSDTADGAGGGWKDGSAAGSTPAGLLYVKVDTDSVDSQMNLVETFMMKIVSEQFSVARVAGRAVAGRATINVTPLAVCALSNVPAARRVHTSPAGNLEELVQYGFRRGVAYDLMGLNPAGADAANFIVDPIDPVGTLGTASNVSAEVVGPYICTGTMPMPKVSGGTITVGRPFPIGALFNHLNARFGLSAGQCKAANAPADSNVKQYDFAENANWMSATPGKPAGQTAAQLIATDPVSGATVRHTVADADPTPGATTAPAYGPLWSYARAAKFSAYAAGVAEPAAGYATFAVADWAVLYNPGKPAATSSYPSLPPYHSGSSSFVTQPPSDYAPGVKNRRVLNVPLLACPVAAGARVSATVLAIGKFFMTVPATDASVPAEFAGIVPDDYVGGQIERKE
jgi:Flp pilus assembly protein TadG